MVPREQKIYHFRLPSDVGHLSRHHQIEYIGAISQSRAFIDRNRATTIFLVIMSELIHSFMRCPTLGIKFPVSICIYVNAYCLRVDVP